MRHRNNIMKLGRTSSHRKAVLSTLSASLFEHKHITTTEAKARAARRVAEKLITLAKKNTLHARRIALERLRQRRAVQALFDEVAPEFETRNGGYTRMIKLGQRNGDGAQMAVLELVGFDMASKKKKARDAKAEAKEAEKTKKKKKAKGEETEPVEEGAEETQKKAGEEGKKEPKSKAKAAVRRPLEEAPEKTKKAKKEVKRERKREGKRPSGGKKP